MPWDCGEKYHFSLDTEKTKEQADDPGKFVADSLKTRECIRCDLWKDEINNLLVFAGLFSAVVTAFIIESYKGLREDPTETAALLLSQLVAILNSTAGGTAAPTSLATPIQSSFSPTPTTTRVNILWFLSLVFSIMTAVIGIVSLQWIREHQRPVQGLTSRFEGALLHMHAEALDRYYVPQIISTLPVLLLVGLVLFLVGLIDFLWNIDHIVASPVLAAVLLTALFLILSTCIPGLQPSPLHLSHRKLGSRPRTPCPYKSPQSWAFLCVVAYCKRLLKFLANNYFKSFAGHLGADLGGSWIKHGLFWLRQRDIDAIISNDNMRMLIPIGENPASYPDNLTASNRQQSTGWRDRRLFIQRRELHRLLLSLSNPERHFSPLYDGVHAHLQVKNNIPPSSSDTLELYRSFNDVLSFTYGSNDHYANLLTTYVHELLPPNQIFTFSQRTILTADPGSSVLLDHTRLLFFLHGIDFFRFPTLTLYHIEMCTRLTQWSLQSEPLLITDIPAHSGIFFVAQYIFRDSISEVRKIEGVDYEKIVEELLGLMTNFFTYASNNHPSAPTEDPRKSIYTTNYVTMMLEDVSSIMNAVPHSPSTTQRFNSHLESIAKEVRRHQDTAGGNYLYWTASLYISLLLGSGGKERYDITGVVRELQEYKRISDAQNSGIRHQYVEALMKCMLSPDSFDEFSWDFLDQIEAADRTNRDIVTDEGAGELGITSKDNSHTLDYHSPSHEAEMSQIASASIESPTASSPSPTASHIVINVVDPLPFTAGTPGASVPQNERADAN